MITGIQILGAGIPGIIGLPGQPWPDVVNELFIACDSVSIQASALSTALIRRNTSASPRSAQY
ncbi:hypothetical protein, partial [Pseudomonas viridiflava]|uniref:hypothetical protein n=1 Tax=Pseudomonas viridiflava TaxID=33069 RepID=UPI0019808AFE